MAESYINIVPYKEEESTDNSIKSGMYIYLHNFLLTSEPNYKIGFVFHFPA